MIRAVVFDVDDTLYLERDYVRSGFEAVGRMASRVWGVEDVAEAAWRLFLAGRRGTTLTDALRQAGVRVDDHARGLAISTYREHVPDIRMLPDALTLIHALGDVPIAVITDGPAVSQRHKCRALGIDQLAAVLLVTNEHGRSKPDPWCFRHVEDRLRMKEGELVYVADNPLKDFTAPLERGWHSARVRRPLSLHADVGTPPGVPEMSDLGDAAQALLEGGLEGFTLAVTGNAAAS